MRSRANTDSPAGFRMWHLCTSRFPQLTLLVCAVRAVSAENVYTAKYAAARSNWRILKWRQETTLLGCQLEQSSLPQGDLGGKSNCKWFHFLVDQILNQCWVMDGLGVKGKAVWEQPGIWEKCVWCRVIIIVLTSCCTEKYPNCSVMSLFCSCLWRQLDGPKPREVLMCHHSSCPFISFFH